MKISTKALLAAALLLVTGCRQDMAVALIGLRGSASAPAAVTPAAAPGGVAVIPAAASGGAALIAPPGAGAAAVPLLAPVVSPTVAGLASIASEFEVDSGLVAAWGNGAIPSDNSGDTVGAFRFICAAGQVLADDPIVYPGQPGKSHLHQFFGNLAADAGSTFESLRRSGGSSCEGSRTTAVNRSAYWMPAMLDGAGSVVRPDYVTIYYKRLPASDPKCSLAGGDPRAQGDCVPLPNGLRFVFGYNMLDSAAGAVGAHYNCDGPGATPAHYSSISAAIAGCPLGSRLGAVIVAPDCWDGRNLDSPDHRSHVAYSGYGWWGYLKCPPSHPYLIPQFTMGVWYTVDENFKAGRWRLASDEMVPGTTPGTTFHADYFEAWDPLVKQMWQEHCIDGHRNASGGDLCNGKQIRDSSLLSDKASPRLVPVP